MGMILGAGTGVLVAGMLLAMLAVIATIGMLIFFLGLIGFFLPGDPDRSGEVAGWGLLAMIGAGLPLYGLVRLGDALGGVIRGFAGPALDSMVMALTGWAAEKGILNSSDFSWALPVLRLALVGGGMLGGILGMIGGGVLGARWGPRSGSGFVLILALAAIIGVAWLLPGRIGGSGFLRAREEVPALSARTPSPSLPPAGGKAVEPGAGPPRPTASPSSALWTVQVRARVRQGPGVTYPILRVLDPGTQVIEQGWVRIGQEEWLHIRLPDGTTGWIRSDLLKRP